ncbi:MAG: YciI family protein [Myxococcota bacterium]
MRYALLLRGDEQAWDAMSPEAQKQAVADYMAFNAELAASKVLAGGAELQPSHTATILRGRDGAIQVTDGPYAESREQIGGFYILEVESLDEALAWAQRCPAVWGGSIEIRPLGTEPTELQGS